MQNKKYLQMLGMARRAGRLAMGHDMAMKSLRDKKSSLIVFASDMSQRIRDEFSLAIQKFNPSLEVVCIEETIDELHFALGYKAGVISVDDENFSKRIKELLNQEESVHGK